MNVRIDYKLLYSNFNKVLQEQEPIQEKKEEKKEGLVKELVQIQI